MPLPPPENLDKNAVALTRALAKIESGGDYTKKGASGELGSAYQWLPSTWQEHATKFLKNPNAPLTPENQNFVAYHQVKEWKDQGLTPDQIFAKWNSGDVNYKGKVGVNKQGVKYDVPYYVQRGMTEFQKEAQKLGGTFTPSANAQTTTPTQPPSPAPSLGGFLGNTLQSGGRFFGDVARGVANIFNPNPQKNTLANIANLGAGALEVGVSKLTGNPINTPEADIARNVGSFYKERYGGLGNIAHTAYTDPVGVAADISALAGGIGLATKGTRLGSIASTVSTATDPTIAATRVASSAAGLGNKAVAATVGLPSHLGYSGAKNVLNISREGGTTLGQMTDAARGAIAPQAFAEELTNAVTKLNRQKFTDYRAALDDIQNNYRPTALKQKTNSQAVIYQNNKLPKNASAAGQVAGDTFSLSTQGPKSALTRILKEFNIKRPKTGKLDFSSSPIPRTDYARIQNIVDDLTQWKDISPKGLNNLENKIAGYYVATEGKRSIGNRIALQASNDIKNYLRERVVEFKVADATYQKTNQLLKEFKRDLSLGGKAGPETILNKIKKAATTDGDLRAGLVQELNKITDKDIKAVTLGLKSSEWTPKGLLATGTFFGSFLHPQFLAALAFSSPRFAFEFLRGLGLSEAKAAQLANTINKSRALLTAGQLGRVSRESENPRPSLGRTLEVSPPQALGSAGP